MPGRGLAIVTGASGVLGPSLLRALTRAGWDVLAVSRRPAATQHPGVTWVRRDITAGLPPELDDIAPPEVLVHAAPLWLLPPLLNPLASRGLRRVVGFGSTSVATKRSSPDRAEREVARRLSEAEDALRREGAALALDWTVLRPTLVYGGHGDKAIGDIARVARRLGFVPVAGAARGLRQPVHADDLADACVAAIDSPATHGQCYDTPGGETLSYADMSRRIASSAGVRPRLLHVPVPLLRAALRMASLAGMGHLRPQMADRMGEDLVFDPGKARRDFGYTPRPFRPGEH